MRIGNSYLWTTLLVIFFLGLGLGCTSSGDNPDEDQPKKVRKVKKVKKTPVTAKKTDEVPKNKTENKTSQPGAPLADESTKKENPLDIVAKDPEVAKKAEEYGLLWKTKKAIADWYYKIGKSLYDKFEFVEAEKNFRKAFEVYPKNVEAHKYLLLTQYLLEKRYPAIKITTTQLQQEREVMIAEKKTDMERSFQRAEKLYSQGKYKEGIRLFEKVVELIRGFPYHIDEGNYAQKTQEYLKDSRKKARLQEIEEMEQKQQIALSKARAEEVRIEEAKKITVRKLLKRANEFIQLRSYEKSIQVLEEVLGKDPENRTAVPLLKLAKEGKALQFQTRVWKETREYGKQDLENTLSIGVPYSDFIRYPSKEEWKIISKRNVNLQSDAFEEPEWIRNYKAQLKGKIIPSLSFKETPLINVVEFLKDLSGLNIVIDPQIDSEEKKVTLPLKNITLENVINILMEKLDLTYVFKNESIFITQKGAKVAKTIFEVLNVQDLLNPIKDFPGPKIRIKASGAAGAGGGAPGGGGGAGGGAGGLDLGGGDGDEEGKSKSLTPEKLIEIIKGSTGEENWADEEKASVEHHRGQLLVVNTPETILKIKKILKQLRKNSGLFVVIEARFIQVFDDYLRDIGVDYRGLGSAGIGMALNLDPNTSGGTDAGFQRQVTGNQPLNENLAGRMQNIFDGFQGFFGGERLGGNGGLSVQSTWLDPFQVSAIMRATMEKQRVTLLTAPVVTAHDRERVNVSVITQRAYIADYDLGSAGTQQSGVEVPDPKIETFQEGVILDVRPIISYDRKYITLNMRPTLANLVGGVINTILVDLGTTNRAAINVPIGTPEIQLQEAHTSVTLPDGGTALLGGFRRITEKSYESSIPFVSNIPLIGIFFKRRGYLKETESMIILVSAKIVDIRYEERKRFNSGD